MPRTFGSRLARSACASALALFVPLAAGAQDPFEGGPNMDELRSEYESIFNAGDAGRPRRVTAARPTPRDPQPPA